jgi:hypothetical protein
MVSLCGFFIHGWAQYQVTKTRNWQEEYPPGIQKRGFELHDTQFAQIDEEPGVERILLFTAIHEQYLFYNIYRNYYVILDDYTEKVKYISDITLTKENELMIDDRNYDGRYEIYRTYFKDKKYKIDAQGYIISYSWIHDRIQWVRDKGITIIELE